MRLFPGLFHGPELGTARRTELGRPLEGCEGLRHGVDLHAQRFHGGYGRIGLRLDSKGERKKDRYKSTCCPAERKAPLRLSGERSHGAVSFL